MRFTAGAPGDGEDSFLAVRDVSFEVARGEFVAIVGPSGCGKTTILNVIAGLLPAFSGVVTVRDSAPASQHHRMGYMFATDALLPWRTALGNVELPLESSRRGRHPERRARAADILASLGLQGFLDAYPDQLSQGMRQRVALARTLVGDPDILLMDEPFGALDAQTKFDVQAELLRIWEGSDRTVVFVTHDLQESILLADRVLVVSGRPGSIASDTRVPFPRPRSPALLDIFVTDEFRALYHDLFWRLHGAAPRTDSGKAEGPP